MGVVLHGCSLFCCGTNETQDLCEQIIRNPDSLDSIALNNEIATFSKFQFELGLLKKRQLHIQKYFSNGFYEKNCEIRNGFLNYEFYGDYYIHPITQEKVRAYLNFGFSHKSGKWKLIQIIDFNTKTNNPYPPGHGNMIGK